MISVILPIYNGEKYLVDSINSVLNQENIAFELILIFLNIYEVLINKRHSLNWFAFVIIDPE